jgi:hypothetical protein
VKSLFNEHIKQSLNYATSVLFELDDQGITVLGVEIAGGRPVITIDREPPSAIPALAVTRTSNGQRVTFNATQIRGCRVQWTSMPIRARA